MMQKKTFLNEDTESLSSDELASMINDSAIKVFGFWTHTKAMERYVIVSVRENEEWKEWRIPYFYRRTCTFIDTAGDLATYVKSCKEFLNSNKVSEFKGAIRDQLDGLFGANATVTKPIFEKLLDNCGEWVCNDKFKLKSSNPQRRIQEIKETGFTIATKTEGKKTYHMLLPFERIQAPRYEEIKTKVRKAIFKAHGNLDAYRGKTKDCSALPDHKFPECRWTADTPESNENLTEEEMRAKFQLVSESVNQAKREVCNRCYLRTKRGGERGMLAGINFFYEGDEKWPEGIPQEGKDAEAGCRGCFWYDMIAWRSALSEIITANKK